MQPSDVILCTIYDLVFKYIWVHLIVTFEDKRRENFNKGQAELEKRQAMLRDQRRKEEESRLAAERAEHEKREKIR